MKQLETIICKNCGYKFAGKYCNNCGQKEFTEKDKSIKNVFEEAFHFITHFEGSFFNSLKTVLFKPSQLTIDYCQGKRKRYFKPISMYLFVVILYLLFPIFSGLNMEISNYTTLPIFGNTINNQIEHKVENSEYSIQQLSDKFKSRSATTSKILLLTLIPFSSIFIKLLFFRKKNYLYKNLILATEINIIYMLVFFLIFPLLFLLILSILRVEYVNDDFIGFLVTLLFGLYCGYIFKKIFASNKWIAYLKGIFFAFIHTFIIITIYKFLVFEVTFFQC